MQLIAHRLPKDVQSLVIAPLGDIQWAGRLRAGMIALTSLREHIARAVDHGAWFIGMGDMLDFLSPSNRQRLKGAQLYDTAEQVIEDASSTLVEQLYEDVLAPTTGRWLGLLEGHHFATYSTGETSDHHLCRLLKAPFLGTSAYVGVVFQTQDGPRTYTIWCHHGAGGGQKAHAPILKLENLLPYWDADLFLIGHMCLPERARIMTRRGFKRHDEVLVGEEVLAFDLVEGRNSWVPLQHATLYEDAPQVALASKSFRVAATPEHQWVIRDYAGRLRLATYEEFKPADDLLTAAPSPGGDSLITPREAAILGWLVTDGCLRWVKGTQPDFRIFQKKPHHVSGLKELLGSDARQYIRRDSGVSQFYLIASAARKLSERSGVKASRDLLWLIPKLSQPARAAMLTAFLQAEGDGVQTFAQKPGPVLDAFLMLTALEGHRTGPSTLAYRHSIDPQGRHHVGDVRRVKIQRRGRGVSTSYLKVSPTDRGRVWCPTTRLGTWVAELDGQVFITGNTKVAAAPIKRIAPTWGGKLASLQERTIHVVGTGGWLKGYAQDAFVGRQPRGNYVEQKMLNPVALGAPIIRVNPKTVWINGGSGSESRKAAGLPARRLWTPNVTVEL